MPVCSSLHDVGPRHCRAIVFDIRDHGPVAQQINLQTRPIVGCHVRVERQVQLQVVCSGANGSRKGKSREVYSIGQAIKVVPVAVVRRATPES